MVAWAGLSRESLAPEAFSAPGGFGWRVGRRLVCVVLFSTPARRPLRLFRGFLAPRSPGRCVFRDCPPQRWRIGRVFGAWAGEGRAIGGNRQKAVHPKGGKG